jgi:hypothetical protein
VCLTAQSKTLAFGVGGSSAIAADPWRNGFALAIHPQLRTMINIASSSKAPLNPSIRQGELHESFTTRRILGTIGRA